MPVTPPITRDDPPLFDKIASHEGHQIEVALYGDDRVGTVNAAVECLDCGSVIVDQDRYPETNPTEQMLMVLNDMGLTEDGVHPEYVRGVLNLAAEIDSVVGRTTSERMEDYALALKVGL